ncbi:MAG: amidohydrolase [Acetobacteraceae bacterium]|jgi:predicted TIM-barrel fold metal-dependent hydrolase|nr:amidohydrolase [Acetobacteraceae bacterium]
MVASSRNNGEFPMKIVDAQIHIWSKGTPSGLHRKVCSFSAEEALREMDEAGVYAAVIHPPASWDPDSNAMAVEAARRYPDRFAVMGQFPPTRPELRHLIKGWKNQPGMLGLRWALLHPEEQVWLRDGTLDWLWPAAEKEGLPVSCMGGLFLKEFRQIAEAHPNLKMILDHCGLVRTGQDEAAFAKLDELVALAKLPNVAVKATGAPHYSTQGYPYKNIHDGLQRIFDAFGPKRFFWGTDITRMPCSYRQCVTFFTEELPWLKGQDLEWVMGRAVCEWLGWNLRFD